MQRLQREVRDAEKPPQGYLGTSTSDAPDAIIYRARSYWFAFSTSFNDAGNSVVAGRAYTDTSPTARIWSCTGSTTMESSGG